MMERFVWKPNMSLATPLYKQIETYIKERIVNGEWTVGTKLPSQRDLAHTFGVNRSTIVMAFDELVAKGYIEGNGRKGTIVVNNNENASTYAPPPNWQSYVETGLHYPNLPAIQEINQAEFYPHVIRLGTGELAPNLLPEKKMKDIMNKLLKSSMILGYEEPKGNFYLRKKIADYLKGHGVYVTPDSILIVSGAIQALQLISMGLLPKGASILLEKPSYLYSLNVFQSAGMRLIGIPMDENGLHASYIPKYKKQFNASILYTIPSFHNPTNFSMNAKKRIEVMEICNEIGLPIIEDAVYQDLWFDEPVSKPLKAYDKNGIVLHIGSMSKVISPGLRIGWIVGSEPVIQRLADIKMQTDYGSSSISQQIAAEWFADGLYDEHLQFVRTKLKKRRDFMLQMLEEYCRDIATWYEPTGGFYIWLHMNVPVSNRNLFDKALKEKILLNPGTLYDRSANQFLRLSYSYATLEEIEIGIKKLAQLMKK
ncbi:GntR family transcriptional regulator [Bacillus cereus]|uniref:GntR family transcriptional regulator n=1 Tax=Bacillus cereus TaxID=1396 RepID=A0A9X6Z9V4_BACCE|nr:PLP-dependent aminotransferase family protein [Bacillus cereus]PFB31474.1 GntR family transcriptional regulator [Bacillus cereus]PFC11665.1 GntR family transcriptional regulator [Bacillus cereus]PFD22207.1 GntR family transcriptional regulator [Bacillus cereus]PFL61286.1 GntR family transcriptional regulator [Bacillus cereus]PGW63399.1 GntR family transcriptional regulator [Bacillus cereus]